MAWLLNRGGQQEGPLETSQIIQMIQSGQLTDGHVAQPGSTQWIPLQQVPEFAQALAGRGVGATVPGGPAGQPGAPAAGGGAPPKKKGAPMGLILGLIGLLVVAGAGVGLYFFFFRGVSSNLSANVPKDTQIFFEIPSAPAALRGFATMDVVDREELEPEKMLEKVQEGLEESFDLSGDEAEALLGDLESVAIAARGLGDDEPEAALVLSFKGTDAVETLLGTDRFEDTDEDIGGGKRYALERVDADYDEMKDWSPARKSFSRMRFEEDSERDAFVWFADAKLLAIGHPDLIEDIGKVSLEGEESLSKQDKWKQANFASDASALLYIDTELAEEIDEKEIEKLVEGYLQDVAPVAGTVGFSDAGVLFTVNGELKGDRIEDEDYTDAAELDVHEHLPAETVLYLAMSTKSGLSGEEAKDRMLEEMEELDENSAKDIEKALETIEEELDIDIEDALDALGDQMAIAVAVDEGFEVDDEPKPEDFMSEMGLGILVHIGDEEKAKELVSTLKEKVFEDGPLEKEYELEDVGDGFDAEPESDRSPEIRVRLEKGFLLIAAGGKAEAFTKALEGEATLDGVKAHARAMDAVGGKPYVIYWEDTGRVAKAMLDFVESKDDMKDELEEAEEETGLSASAFRFEGDERVTSAFSISVTPEKDRWSYSVKALNLPMATMGAGSFLFFSSRSAPGEVAVPTPSGGGGNADVPQVCKDYLKKFEDCQKTLPESAREGFKKSGEALKKSLDMAKGNKAMMDAMTKSCEAGVKALERTCK